MARWSKLKKQIENLFVPELDLQVRVSVYPMRSQRGSTDIPRYWITLDKNIIWDYPKDFLNSKHKYYPYVTDVPDISDLIREYIDTPVAETLQKKFEKDEWRLTEIFKAADRRIGRRRIEEYFDENDSLSRGVEAVLEKRLED